MTTLETDRLILRGYKESDLNDLHRLLSDKKAMYFLDDIGTNSIEESAKNLKDAISNTNGRRFCIRDKTSGQYIGAMGYHITAATPLGKIVHMGYFLLPEHHGHGYATEAAKKVIEFALLQDGCIRITTACYKDNEPSRNVIEKVGFRREGERIKAQYHDGVMKDRLEYGLNKGTTNA